MRKCKSILSHGHPQSPSPPLHPTPWIHCTLVASPRHRSQGLLPPAPTGAPPSHSSQASAAYLNFIGCGAEMGVPEPQSPLPPASPGWASLDVRGSTAKARSWDFRHSSVAPSPASIGPRLRSSPTHRSRIYFCFTQAGSDQKARGWSCLDGAGFSFWDRFFAQGFPLLDSSAFLSELFSLHFKL